jgi:hypothetical protein
MHDVPGLVSKPRLREQVHQTIRRRHSATSPSISPQSAVVDKTLTGFRKSRFCIAESFFNSLLNQKTARLPAAPEDKRRAAKPRAIVEIQLQGEAGKRTARQRRSRRRFPGCHDGKRRTAAASL